METWQKREIGTSADALVATAELTNAVTAYGLAVSGEIPPRFGVFSRYDLAKNSVTWWFSPEAAPIAKAFNAKPCEKPVPEEGFGLMAGSAATGEVHFPDHFPRRWGN